MKTSFSYKQPELREQTEKEVESHLAKLNSLLKRYAPDLVQLHGSFGKIPHRESFSLSLNLSLPTGTLHATGEADDVLSSVRAAFSEVLSQVKKHQGKLRKDYEWKRKRGRRSPSLNESLVS
jgi:ribosome-associated translation inhibitor RaiA